ncbi:MAG: transcriptional regulator NrdR, partial [Okeania sp. SIO2H7]|nr:transcriptional regulator NrdR [Okeania sp. SIO2H7]
MQCPICQHPNSRVLESRSTEAGQSVRRRRECLNCQHRFTTYERIEFVPITVIKKDGARESFDKSKLTHALIHSCEKTGVESKEIEAMVEVIEAEIMGRSLREIT